MWQKLGLLLVVVQVAFAVTPFVDVQPPLVEHDVCEG